MISKRCAMLYLSSMLYSSSIHALFFLPESVITTILKYFSTEQLLQFREVNTQAQQVAENTIITTKRVLSFGIVKKNSLRVPPVSVVKKCTSLRLYSACALYLQSLCNNVSHVHSIELNIIYPIPHHEQSGLPNILLQLTNIESLKIYNSLVSKNKKAYQQYAHMLKSIPVYSYLKRLHINTPTPQAVWDMLDRILPHLEHLQVLHVESKFPIIAKRFSAFIQLLPKFIYLKKLCLYLDTIPQKQAPALLQSLRMLKSLRCLNLRKTSVFPTLSDALKKYYIRLPNVRYIAPAIQYYS